MKTSIHISNRRFLSPSCETTRDVLEPIALPLPKIWVGYAFALLYWLVEAPLLFHGLRRMYPSFVNVNEFQGSSPHSLSQFLLLISFISWGYWLFCIHRIHKVLAKVSHNSYPISPRKAVGFMFIPVFNLLYWNFKWTGGIAIFIKSRSSHAKVAKYWPGVALLAAWFLGVFVDSGLRMLIVYSVGFYLTRKIGTVVRCTEKASIIRKKEPLSVSISAGLGAAFAFILAQAVRGLPHHEHKAEEAIAIFLVSLGLMWFIEPVSEKIRHWFGISEDHSPLELQKPVMVQAAVFAFLVITSMSHALLHEQILHHLDTTGLMLFIGLVTSGGITYFWLIGAQHSPRQAARMGLTGGAVLSLFVLSPLGVTMVKPMLNNFASALAQGSPIPGFGSESNVNSLVANDAPNGIQPGFQQRTNTREQQEPEPVPFLLIALACPLFGLAGGLAIDRSQSKFMANYVLSGLLLSAIIISLVARWRGLPRSDIQGLIETVFFIAGWWAGLFVYPSVSNMLAGPKPPAASAIQSLAA